jgi:hypothetical protein
MVICAPVLARNHASVGPAIPAPLINTRIAGRNSSWRAWVGDGRCEEAGYRFLA